MAYAPFFHSFSLLVAGETRPPASADGFLRHGESSVRFEENCVRCGEDGLSLGYHLLHDGNECFHERDRGPDIGDDHFRTVGRGPDLGDDHFQMRDCGLRLGNDHFRDKYHGQNRVPK